jgi:hypothetical protein
MKANWRGVIPVITTPFDSNLTVDHGFPARSNGSAWEAIV